MRPRADDTWGAEERAAVEEVLSSGRVTMGEKTAAFEAAYAEYVGSKYAVAVNSGSSANLLMVAAWTLANGPGTVIVPTVGWATSYSPFAQYGWKMLFVDVEPDTLQYENGAMMRACAQADLILTINLLGNPMIVPDESRLPILEDNCESMGAEFNGFRTGTFGRMASHSTYFSHHMCTMEGGLITTDDEYYYHMLLSLRSHGWTRHLPEVNALEAKVDKFHFILPGYNVRPTEMQSAIGLAQLKKLPGFIEQRRENASRFPVRTQKEVGRSSWFGFMVHKPDWDRFRDFETRPVVSGNFLRQPVIRHYKHKVIGETAGADYIHDNCIMIGNSHNRIEWPT